jgi:hypothetical protein
MSDATPIRGSHLLRAKRKEGIEMSTKKTLLLATAALAAMALAVPAAASAEVHPTLVDAETEEPVAEETTFELSGSLTFETGGSGTTCIVHSVVTVTNAETFDATFEATIPACEAFGKPFGNCTLEESNPVYEDETPGWMVNLDDHSFTVENVEIHNVYDSGCPAGEYVDLEFESILAHPVDTEGETETEQPINHLEIKGEGNAIITDGPTGNPLNSLPNVTEGTLTVTGEDAGKYKIITTE